MELKLHQNLIELAKEALFQIMEQHLLSDKVVPRIIKHKKLGARDRTFLASLLYDIVRWRLLYETYRINLLIDNIEPYTALILISLVKQGYQLKNPELLNADEALLLRISNYELAPTTPPYILASYEPTLYEYIEGQLPKDWETIANSLNQKALVYIRINPDLTTLKDFTLQLKNEGIQFQIIPNNFNSDATASIALLSKNNLKQTIWFKEHYFYFQDLGSQKVGHFIQQHLPNSVTSVLDICAGRGGKTFQLATLLPQSVALYATDINERRLSILSQSTNKKIYPTIRVLPYTTASQQRYDAILIDAPCSGLGTIRRQPDIKYHLSPKKIEEYVLLQQQVLNTAQQLLNPKGILFYVTCSLLPQENEQQVAWFLQQYANFRIIASKTILPNDYDCDGFYMAALKCD